MANVTNVTLDPILERLNSATAYHPFDAETFSDWATEAGDVVEISRNGETYRSPIHVSRMVWKGKAPTMQISTTGNEKREAVAKMSRKKYGRGSAGIMSQEGIHRAFVSPDGILHSELHITESYLRTEYTDIANSLRGEFELTASHMRTEYVDLVHSLRGELEVTASHMRTEFTDEVNSLRGELEVTASHMRTEFTDQVNSLHGELEVTASNLRANFRDDINNVESHMSQTASSWEARVAPISDPNGNITPASIALSLNNSGSEVKINADKIRLLGQVIADTIDADYIATQLESVGSLLVHNITADDIEASSLKIRPVAGMGAVNVATGYNGSSLTLNGNTYTLRLAKFNGQYDEYSFSRATTLSGAWSGRKFTVTATPQGDTSYTDLFSSIPNANVSWNGTVATMALKATINGGETAVDVGDVTMDVASFLQDKTGTTRKFTTNGLYSADSGYIGFGNIEIDVPQSTVDPTTLSILWNGSRRLNANASPQGVSRYTEIVSSVPNEDIAVSGATLTLPLKATYDGGETAVNVGSVTANISGKLQSKNVSSNGTYTPDSGYIGFSSVTVSGTAGNAVAHFGVTSGQYYIEAVDPVSRNPFPNSNINYSLGVSGANVTINTNTAGQSVPSIALDISQGTLDTSTGTRRLTVTAGGTATTATLDITDYSAGKSSVTVSSVAINGNTSYASKSYTVPVTATASNNNTKSVNLTVDGTDAYNAGWRAYYAKWRYPTSGTGQSMTVYWPQQDPDSAWDGISRAYALEDKDNNTVWLRYNSQTYAQYEHGKYNAGWGAAKNVCSIPTGQGTSQYVTIKYPQVTVGGQSTLYYYVTTDDDYAYIKLNGTSGTTLARVSNSAYGNGQTAAGLSINGNGTNTVTRALTSSTKSVSITATAGISYNSSTHKYTATAQSKAGSTNMGSASATSGTEAYDAGYSKGVDDYYGDYIAPVFSERYQDNYNGNQYKSDGGAFIRKIHASANTGIHIPLSENGANMNSPNLTEIPSGGITANGNYKFRSGYAGIRYLSVNVPGSSASYSFSGISGGSCSTQQITNVLAGYTLHQTSGVPNSSNQTWRYVKFSVDGRKHAIYFS